MRHVPITPTVRQAAILMGRLDSALLPCGDRPFLAWLIRELIRFGVEDILLLTGPSSSVLEAALPGIVATLPKPVTITCSAGPEHAGTGGALYHARDYLDDRFLLCNGNSIMDFNMARLLSDAAVAPDMSRIVLRDVSDTAPYGVVLLDGDRVTTFQPGAAAPGPGLVNAGIYLLGHDILSCLSPVCSLEVDVLPALAVTGRLRATLGDGVFIDLRLPADLARAQTALPQQFCRPALFLDRDGTINRDHAYVGTRERWEWIDGALDAIRLATEAGWHVFVVTNQSGIARGFYDETALGALHAWMTEEVRRIGGTIDDIRYCPFHEEAVLPHYRRASEWRKPAPGMLLDLLARWDVDPARSLLVGDQPSDMAAAAAAAVRGQFFDGSNLFNTVAPLLCDPNPTRSSTTRRHVK
jgi:D,D-heptose 1,7-bisphosphate phosphatase